MQIIKIHEYFKIRFILDTTDCRSFFFNIKRLICLFTRCVTLDQLLSFFEYYFPHF